MSHRMQSSISMTSAAAIPCLITNGCDVVFHAAATAYEGLSVYHATSDHGEHRYRFGITFQRRHCQRCQANYLLLINGQVWHECCALP